MSRRRAASGSDGSGHARPWSGARQRRSSASSFLIAGFRALGAGAFAFRRFLIAPFGQKLESQRARDRRRLDQLHGHRVAQPVALAGMVADQRVAWLVIAEIIVADRARGNEA